MSDKIEVGQAMLDNNEVTITEIKAGWATYTNEDSTVGKARVGKFESIIGEDDNLTPTAEEQAAMDAEGGVKRDENGNEIQSKPKGEKDRADRLLNPDHDRYTRGLGETASGNETYDIADKVAEDLRGMNVAELYTTLVDQVIEVHEANPKSKLLSNLVKKAAKKNIVIDPGKQSGMAKRFDELYGHLNVGMIRMNVGNRIRSLRADMTPAPTTTKQAKAS